MDGIAYCGPGPCVVGVWAVFVTKEQDAVCCLSVYVVRVADLHVPPGGQNNVLEREWSVALLVRKPASQSDRSLQKQFSLKYM